MSTSNIPETIKLEVSKALGQLFFLDRSYNLGIWSSGESKADWLHDLNVMRFYDNLRYVSLELLATDRTILASFRIDFGAAPTLQRGADSAQGVEVPVWPTAIRGVVADKRVVVGHRGKDSSQYRHLLKKHWGPADNLLKRNGNSYTSEHAAQITGGRQTGSFHVAAEARHRMVVTRIGRNGYAFAKAPDLGVDGVFLLPRYASPGFWFYVGQELTALLVQTPRGVQARAIQAA